jgi:hypothetical protein
MSTVKKRTATKKRIPATKRKPARNVASKRTTKSASMSVKGIKIMTIKQVNAAMAQYKRKVQSGGCGSKHKKRPMVRRRFVMKVADALRWRKIVRRRRLKGPILFTKAGPGKVHVHNFSGGCRLRYHP